MLRHNLLLIYRNFQKFKSTFLINLIGLSVGLASALLIFLWITDEWSMEQYHENKAHLYQVMTNHDNAGGIVTSDAGPGLLAEALETEISQVRMAAATSPFIEDVTLVHEDEKTVVDGQFVDQDYFDMFTVDLLEGSRDQLLTDINGIVLSEKAARKLFKNPHEAIGKTLEWQVYDFSNQVRITGVYRDYPDNSTVQPDFLLSFPYFKKMLGDGIHWDNHNTQTYLLLEKGTDIDEFNGSIKNFIQTKLPQSNVSLYAQRFADRYLYGTFENGVPVGGRISYINLFSIIALFVLAIACINFMNLTTARAIRRGKEVGIKKAIGARRYHLVRQFLTESLVVTFLALVVAILLVYLLLPYFNSITGKQLGFRPEPGLIFALTGIGALTGLLAGTYPALYLSGFHPSQVLKGNQRGSISELLARKGLVVFQFTLSLIMIISVVVVSKQITYIQSQNLGYNQENLVQITSSGLGQNRLNTFLEQLRGVPGVVKASSLAHPLTGLGSATIGLDWKGKDPDDIIKFENITVNYDLIETLNLSVVEGRAFSREFSAEETKLILNQKAVEIMGLNDPVGQMVNLWGNDMEVIGVVGDFNFESLRESIKPAFLKFSPKFAAKIMVRIAGGQERETLTAIEKLYKEFNPGLAFDYGFLDEDFQSQYVAEQRISVLSKYFGGLAILISCLGLFGLAAFTSESRKKEIGIRKVLGASVAGVMALLTSEFVRLIFLSMAIAVPIAWWMCHAWLAGFAYKTSLDWWIFMLSGLLVIIIALLTVSTQAFRAAAVNPVESLKSE